MVRRILREVLTLAGWLGLSCWDSGSIWAGAFFFGQIPSLEINPECISKLWFEVHPTSVSEYLPSQGVSG